MWHSIPLTLFWFTYFGSLGIFFPYFSLYLRENAGLSGTQLGVVLAISPLVGMIAQPLWGQVADRTGARSRVLAFLTLGTALGYAGLGLAQGFGHILIAMAALASVGTAVFPLMISVSLAILRDAGRHAFGRVRVWGTIGYFILILLFPWFLNFYQPPGVVHSTGREISQPGLGLMFPITAALVLVAAFIAFVLPQKGAVALRAQRGDWRELMRNGPFLRFLFFALAAHFLMHGPMWLFPLFVRSRGGDLEMIRAMWILMLTFEVPLVFLTGSGLKRLGARGLLAVGVFVGGLRWTLCARTHRSHVAVCRPGVSRRDGGWPQLGKPALPGHGRPGTTALDRPGDTLHGGDGDSGHRVEHCRRLVGRPRRDGRALFDLRFGCVSIGFADRVVLARCRNA